MDAGQWAILGLCVILGLGFILGSVSNARKLRWISRAGEAALAKYGPVTTSRRLGNSGIQLIVDKAASPYRQVELVVLLEARENLLLWVFDRLRGRRDELLLRANLRTAPAEEIHLGDVRVGKVTSERLGEQGAALGTAWARPGVDAQGGAGEGHGTRSRVKELLDRYGPQMRGLSLQRKEPQLSVRTTLGASDADSFEALLETIRHLVRPG